ncbi:MAG TPA: ThuA domain-containing protein [Chthonomonadales bacterium]|nr:ThuA domain-containing protein [Chthonomonadales bacterium]
MLLVWLLAGLAVAPPPAEQGPVRVLVVTGGHDFERAPFEAMWRSMQGIEWREAAHPAAHAEWRPEASRRWDVLVLYDMPAAIGEEAREDLRRLLRQGKGIVALHHSLASYPDWPEYEEIIGGRFLLAPRTVNGVHQPASRFQHDVRFDVRVADRRHPVTRGVDDFTIVDETYGGFVVSPGVRPLLTTTEATSGPTIGWAKTSGRSRVVYLMLGHGPTAYEHPAYRRLVHQAILWVARRR